MWASDYGHRDVVELLLQNERVNPAAVDNGGSTAFMLACKRGHLDVAKLLLSHPRTNPTAITTGGAFPDYTVRCSGKSSCYRRAPPLRLARRARAAKGGRSAPCRHQALSCPPRVGAPPRRRVRAHRVLGVARISF